MAGGKALANGRDCLDVEGSARRFEDDDVWFITPSSRALS